MKKIVLTGGGTAGHIYPALALVPYLKEYDIHYIGSNGMEKEVLKKFNNITFHEIPAVKLIRKMTLKNLLIPFKLFSSIKKAKEILKQIKPNIIFSKGGFVSVPVVFAGKKLGIPIVSHESDLSMGLANKLILKKCDVMCTSFLETSKKSPKCIYTGQPIRREILNGNPAILKNKFRSTKPILLVVGGSLGASFFNKKVKENFNLLTSLFNVIHITGKGNVLNLKDDSYLQIEYSNNMPDIFASADLVLSRAGSGVINELLALQKPMLLIPLSKRCSRGDQIENAELFTRLGYSQMILEEDATNEKILTELSLLLKNSGYYRKNMKRANVNNANEKIIEIIKNKELN